MMIKHFSDLQVWQKADLLAHEVLDLSETFPRKYLLDLTGQLRRAALSVPTNLAEGSASPHTKELLQSVNVARKSVREVQYLLLFALRRELMMVSQHESLTSRYEEVFRMLNSLTRALKARSRDGKASVLPATSPLITLSRGGVADAEWSHEISKATTSTAK